MISLAILVTVHGNLVMSKLTEKKIKALGIKKSIFNDACDLSLKQKTSLLKGGSIIDSFKFNKSQTVLFEHSNGLQHSFFYLFPIFITTKHFSVHSFQYPLSFFGMKVV